MSSNGGARKKSNSSTISRDRKCTQYPPDDVIAFHHGRWLSRKSVCPVRNSHTATPSRHNSTGPQSRDGPAGS